MFFQSTFSAFSSLSLCKKFLYTYKKQRAGVAGTAKEYSIYLDSAYLAPLGFLSQNVNATKKGSMNVFVLALNKKAGTEKT